MHSTPNPNSDIATCCFGERKMGILPVPIINKSNGSFVESSNRNSLSISDIVEIESSSDLLADIKHGVFNLVWESETDKSY